MKNLTNKTKQQGAIATTDLILALVILGIVIFGIFQVAQGMRGSVVKDQIITQLKAHFPQAVNDCLKLTNDLNFCTQDRIASTGIVDATRLTPCGDTWTVLPHRDRVSILYPLVSCDNPRTFAAEIVNHLNTLHKISALTDNATGTSLRVDYLQ